jgi:ribosomal protein S18 acetylase RimI-like enzyme
MSPADAAGTPAYTLREATENDLAGLARVYARAYAQPPWNERNDPTSSARYLQWVMREPGTFGLVALAPHPVSSGSAGANGSGETGGDTVVGFVLAGERPYAAFVEDWQRTADLPPEGWPVLAGRLGYVWEIAVEPDAQRRGIGAALLGDAIARLRAGGVEQVVLRSSERATAAVALYRRFGFERLPLRERLDPLAGPWLLALRPAGVDAP